jgi:hypothetical protein
MRKILCVIAACGGIALTGCVAVTTGATNVGENSARLNAYGRSDDSPAHFYFRYADNKADLGTAAGKTTPKRTVPANVPSDGGRVHFGENVTGLSPGRLYWFEVCGGDSTVSPDLCGGVKSFFTTPTTAQDWIQSRFRYGGEYGLIVNIDAASGPQGQNADGRFTDSIRYFGNRAEGEVTCLLLNGNRVVVGVVGTRYREPFEQDPVPYSAVWTLDAGNQTFHETITSSPPNCAAASFDQQQDSFDWSLAVHDAP